MVLLEPTQIRVMVRLLHGPRSASRAESCAVSPHSVCDTGATQAKPPPRTVWLVRGNEQGGPGRPGEKGGWAHCCEQKLMIAKGDFLV